MKPNGNIFAGYFSNNKTMTKKKGVIRELLGVSQKEMAILLKINRAQWSMFESGKRDLPFEAKIQFAEMLTYVQSARKETSKNKPKPSPSDEKSTKKLKSSLPFNQHRQLITAKKIENLQKKQAMAKAALYLEGFCEKSLLEQPKFVADKIEEILKRANNDVQLGESAEMIQLQIKLKVLQYEEPLLKTALEKYP